MYSIPDLETFVTVSRRGGITPAARTLGISAATTSHRIAKLEAALGTKLFHRSSRRFDLNDEGLRFLERVEGILADLRHAELEVGGRAGPVRGHLSVTLPPWLLSRFILPALPEFQQAHPDLAISFLAVDRFVSLVEEGQDCGLRVGNLADSALIARKISENDRILCASPACLERFGTPQTADALEEMPWVCLPWQTEVTVTSGPRSRRLTMSRKLTVSNSDMLTDAALQGLGLAIKSRLAVTDELTSGALVEVMPGRLDPVSAPIWFVYPPSARNSRKTLLFGDLAEIAFRAGPLIKKA